MLARRQAELRIAQHVAEIVLQKNLLHPAPCLPKASRALSELFLLRFLWQKVKLGRGLPPSC